MNLCRACGLDFATVSSFDAHRVGNHDYTMTEGLRMEPPRHDGRHCLIESELEQAGWRRDRHGRWLAPDATRSEPILERVAL